MSGEPRVTGSFRDPSGFLFVEDGTMYRQINPVYAEHYGRLMDSGLYEKLSGAGHLVPHEEVDPGIARSEPVYKVIRPELIPFISYPYEWCFSQLKDAALTTLAIQRQAIDYGMVLKDASAYNIQFRNGKPIFIDTLSFETYTEGQPWIAYRQFCQHFLAPLSLMAYNDVRLATLSRVFLDGVPLDLAARILPFRTRFKPAVLTHIHMHAGSQARYADRPDAMQATQVKFSKLAMLALIDSLEGAVKSLRWRPRGTPWAEYYDDLNYSSEALEHKQALVAEFVDQVDPRTVWDLGANTGLFSRIAAGDDRRVISFDIDPAAVERSYLEVVEKREERILPLVLDLTNPSPGIGWHNGERMAIPERGPADTALALALVHHLAIGNNLPFARIAEFLSAVCGSLVIEFVPKTDSQVQRLLASREDVFEDYHQAGFEAEFGQRFTILRSARVEHSERVLYLMETR